VLPEMSLEVARPEQTDAAGVEEDGTTAACSAARLRLLSRFRNSNRAEFGVGSRLYVEVFCRRENVHCADLRVTVWYIAASHLIVIVSVDSSAAGLCTLLRRQT
jgi:hypothetical protein